MYYFKHNKSYLGFYKKLFLKFFKYILKIYIKLIPIRVFAEFHKNVKMYNAYKTFYFI